MLETAIVRAAVASMESVAHPSAQMIVIAVKDVSVMRVLVLKGRAVLKTMTALMVPSAKALRVYRVSAAMTLSVVCVRSVSPVAVSDLSVAVTAIASLGSAVTQDVASRAVE